MNIFFITAILNNQIYCVRQAIGLSTTVRALCCWDVNFRPPTTAAKFIIKCSLFVQKFKVAGQAATEDWLCFWPSFVGHAQIA
jgi:hypothetical protein